MDGDRIQGTGRRIVGKAQRPLGDLAANDRLEDDGVADRARGAVQDGYGRARARVRDLLDGAPGLAREAVATGRDYYRRGSAAVARNATDNTALTVLAAGVAVAAVSWLVLGRRTPKGER